MASSQNEVTVPLVRRSNRHRTHTENTETDVISKRTKNDSVVLSDIEKSTLTCSICDKKYSRIDNLIVHHRYTHGDEVVQCEICSKKFSSAQGLERHQETHTDERRFTCNTCSKSFKRAHTLAVHEQTHCDDQFRCTQCQQVFNSKLAVQRHLRSRTDEAYHPAEGSIAEIIHSSKGEEWVGRNCNGTRHVAGSVQFIATDDKKNHQCPHCFKCFEECFDIWRHWTTHHCWKEEVPNGRFYLYNGVEYELSDTIRHLDNNHRRIGFNCDVCYKLFASKHEISKHKTSKHSVASSS